MGYVTMIVLCFTTAAAASVCAAHSATEEHKHALVNHNHDTLSHVDRGKVEIMTDAQEMEMIDNRNDLDFLTI